jgi:predicted nuclease of predicted toxin-antitoxin system
LAPEVKEVIFYSDTCGGQNKNNIVTMMFLYLIKLHPTLEKISHKFLVSRHTHMECDSDHALIKKTKKKTQMKINHLYDLVQLIRTCKVQKPFQVVVLTLEDFFDFSSLKTKKGPYNIKKQDESGEKFLWQPVK